MLTYFDVNRGIYGLHCVNRVFVFWKSKMKKTIDLRFRMYSTKLYSRLVWQELFNIYRENGGDLSNMDSLLCDLYTLERWFDNIKNLPIRKSVNPLYWRFVGNFTDISDFQYDDYYKISVVDNCVFIEKAGE